MSERREVSLGFGATMIGFMLVFALWGIGTELNHIAVQLKLANCIAEAKIGVLCHDAKDQGK